MAYLTTPTNARDLLLEADSDFEKRFVANAKSVVVTSTTQVFTYSGTGALFPTTQYIPITAARAATGNSITWSTIPSGVPLYTTSDGTTQVVTTPVDTSIVYLHGDTFGITAVFTGSIVAGSGVLTVSGVSSGIITTGMTLGTTGYVITGGASPTYTVTGSADALSGTLTGTTPSSSVQVIATITDGATFYDSTTIYRLQAGAAGSNVLLIQGDNSSSPTGKYVKVNSVTVSSAYATGHKLVVINPTTGAVLSQATYNTTTSTTALITALDAVIAPNIITLTSFGSTACDVALRTKLNSMGGTLTSTWVATAQSHVFIGSPGLSAGQGFEKTDTAVAVAASAYFTILGLIVNGTIGSDARVVDLTTTAQAFAYTAAGSTPSPTTATITATAQNTSGTVYYEFLIGTVSQQNTTSNTYTYTPETAFTSMPKQITVKVREGATDAAILATDTMAMIGLRPGTNAVSGFLTNEAATVAASSAGVIASYTGTGGTFSVYDGITDKTGNTATVTYSVVGTPTGITASIATTGVYTLSAMTVDSTSVTFRAVYAGVTIDKIYSIAKSKAGTTGVNAVSINYTNDSLTVPVSSAGVATWAGSGGLLQIYDGGSPLNLITDAQTASAPASGTTGYNLDITTVTGDTLTEPVITGVGTNTATVAAWAGTLTTATVYRITAYIRRSDNTTLTLLKDVSISPSKAGIDSTVYYIALSAPVITKESSSVNTDGVHSSISIQGKKSTGDTTTNYGWITYTANGDTEVETAANTAATPVLLAPIPAADKSSYTIKMYSQEDVDPAKLLDTQVINIVFKGNTGTSGINAPSINYTNDNLTVPVSSAGTATWTASGGLLQVYDGATALILRSTASNETAAPISTSIGYNLAITKVSGDTLTIPTITNTIATSPILDVWAGTLTTATVYRITAYIRRTTTTTVTISKDISIIPGIPGADSTVYYIALSAPVITKEAPDAATSGVHSSISIQGKKSVGSTVSNYGWVTYTPNGVAESAPANTEGVGGAAVPYSLTPGNTDAKTSYTIKMYSTEGKATLLDTQVINLVFKGAPGADGIAAYLTNPTHNLQASNNGTLLAGEAAAASTNVVIMQAGVNVTSSYTIAVGTPTTGLTISGTNPYAVATLTADSGYVDFTATRTGYASIVLRFSVARIKASIDGTSPVLVYLTANYQGIVYDKNGDTASPTTTTFTATPKNTVGTITYSFKVDGTLQGTTGTANTNTYTLPTTIFTTPKVVLVEMLSNDTIVATDTLTIVATKIGATGADAVTINLLSPTNVFSTVSDGSGFSGTSIPNNTIRVYKAGTLVTATSYGSGATAGTQAQVVNGITATVTASTSGTIAFTGTWTTGTDTSVFTFNAVYLSQTYTTTYSIAKSKTGPVSTTPGPTGIGTHRAYKATTSNTVVPSIPVSSTIGVAPATQASPNETGTAWGLTPANVDATNTTQWQSDGTSAAGAATVTWTTPYLSYFKVAELSAITATIGRMGTGGVGADRTIIATTYISIMAANNNERVRIGFLGAISGLGGSF